MKYFKAFLLTCAIVPAFANSVSDPFKDLSTLEKKAYMKGITDAFKFLDLQYKTDIPKPGFWVIKDVSNYSPAQITVFAIFIEQKGYRPALVLNRATGQIYLVAGSFSDKTLAELVQRRLYPLRTFVSEVKNTKLFQRAVINSKEIAECGKIEVSLDGAIQLLEATKALLNQIASQVFDKERAKKDLDRIVNEIKRVEKNFIETEKYLEQVQP